MIKSIINALIFLYEKTINVLYPTQCIICGKSNDKILCNKCNKDFKDNLKIDKNKNKYYDEYMYLFKYEGLIRKLIIDYKFNDKAYIYDFFVNFIIKNKKICRKLKNYDIIIPVPIHKKRKKERGYNQCELITRKVSKNFENLKHETKVLVKIINNKRQSELSKEERKQNVKEVYNVKNSQKISNKKIILFDDIFTTGSTVNECAKLLKNNGAKRVLVITIAKD